ncbi:MAG: septum formation protein Maf [Oscillospiraceae bacterium]|nr:septum formation protein Maf [Oscillospiraceae bacterium]
MYILASGSPRRKELLSLIVPEYEILVSGCEESVPECNPAEKVPAILAEQKALAVASLRPKDTVIGSDTVVVLDDEIFGQPKDFAHAHQMLRALSGKRHFVYTGVAVAEKGGVRSFVQKTEVEFYELSDETIDNYIATGEPMDKAGAYGIQGKGSVLVKGITGDYFNVMGLPVAETARFLGIVK